MEVKRNLYDLPKTASAPISLVAGYNEWILLGECEKIELAQVKGAEYWSVYFTPRGSSSPRVGISWYQYRGKLDDGSQVFQNLNPSTRSDLTSSQDSRNSVHLIKDGVVTTKSVDFTTGPDYATMTLRT